MTWDWKFAGQVLPVILEGLIVTLQAVSLGMAIALVVGLVWAVLRRSPTRWIRWPVTAGVEFVRSTPLLVQLYFLYYVIWPALGLPDWPLIVGICALGLHYSCYTAEVYRAGIEGVSRGQWEAATALNMSPWLTYRLVILPQAIPPVIPALGNYLIAMFKDTPLLSAITVLEMLRRAQMIGKETFRFLEPLTIVGLIFLILSLASGLLIGWLQRKLAVAQQG